MKLVMMLHIFIENMHTYKETWVKRSYVIQLITLVRLGYFTKKNFLLSVSNLNRQSDT